MKNSILIASDLHGNLTCLKNLLKQGIDPSKIYILGDVLCNGVSEKEDEILDLIKRERVNFLRGNHEDEFLDAYSGNSRRIARIQRSTAISPKNRRFLRKSPKQYQFGNIWLVHTPIPPRRIKNIESALEGFSSLHTQICFHGHYHHPRSYSYDPRNKECREEEAEVLSLKEDTKYLINPGSLGVNRTYLVYSPEQKTVRRFSF